jgi:hypothetical protein
MSPSASIASILICRSGNWASSHSAVWRMAAGPLTRPCSAPELYGEVRSGRDARRNGAGTAARQDACELNHKEDSMSAIIVSSPAPVPALGDRDIAESADREHQPRRSRIWALAEAFAYAGATLDPTAALAARRFARIRDEELGRGRR